MKLLRSERFTLSDDGYTILTVEISAFDRTVVLARNAHVGPVNVSGFNIDDDAVRNPRSVDDDFSIRDGVEVRLAFLKECVQRFPGFSRPDSNGEFLVLELYRTLK